MCKPRAAGVFAPYAVFPTLACCAALAACGGGGGDSGSGNAAFPAPATAPAVDSGQLGAYLGSWRGACVANGVDTATITRVSASSIGIADKTDYFAAADCSGTPVATVTRSADTGAAYQDSVDASVVLAPGAPPVLLRIDRVGATLPAHRIEVAGPAVTRQLVDGRPEWCIDLGAGQSRCIADQGSIPASSSDAALYASGDVLYRLAPEGAGYLARQRYTRLRE